MLQDFFSKAFLQQIEAQASPDQIEAVRAISDFVFSTNELELLLLKGYAGTGKTFLISRLIRLMDEYKQKTILLAPTGRAAKVLSAYAGKEAFTIHKKIYRQRSAGDINSSFSLDRNLHRDTLFVVDEASMIANQSSEQLDFGSGRLLDDLIEYVYTHAQNCRLILIGDEAQLPPVGLDLSPALDAKVLKTYLLNNKEINLKTVIRQKSDSGILHNATQLRNTLPLANKLKSPWPKLKTNLAPDVRRISGSELIELIDQAYSKYGMEETTIITRTNKRANRFNQGIRNTILYREDEISTGDYVMVVKNNYFWTKDEIAQNPTGPSFIANGDTAEIVRIQRFEEMYGFRFADATIRLVDYADLEFDVKLLIDTLHSESAALTAEQQKQFYQTVAAAYDTGNARARNKAIRDDEYYNALQIKFAYAITCHKAQGGQWDAVFVDQGYFVDTMLNREYIRWLYTAFTRAVKQLYLINFAPDFFDQAEPDAFRYD